MPSKREKLYQAAERLPVLRCPVCGGDLTRAGDDFACHRGHRVNVNRRGCLNFLSAPADSCYDAALFQARRCMAPTALTKYRLERVGTTTTSTLSSVLSARSSSPRT